MTNLLLRSCIIYASIFGWQIIKSFIIGEVNVTILGVILSVVVGILLSNYVINK